MNRKLSIVLAVMVLLLLVTPVSAGGATQIRGIGYFDDPEEPVCVDPEGDGSVLAVKLTGDLNGCFYVFPETSECRPSGVYVETGIDVYVGGGGEGDVGTFETTYRFIAKVEDCDTLSGEKFGRCQHPVIAGSGTDDYDGVKGRLAFRDEVEDGMPIALHYRGHLKR